MSVLHARRFDGPDLVGREVVASAERAADLLRIGWVITGHLPEADDETAAYHALAEDREVVPA